MNISTHHTVDDLPSDQRQTLETILGRKLETKQHLFILACSPDVIPDTAAKEAAHDRIAATLDKAHEHALSQSVNAEEADSVVNEAMDDVRRRS
ncbi:MAG: hypothetical protein R3E01_30500 [Pirellulaceae bacterium]|nr:hypothetical protein [Planctomycetales bacterium]